MRAGGGGNEACGLPIRRARTRVTRSDRQASVRLPFRCSFENFVSTFDRRLSHRLASTLTLVRRSCQLRFLVRIGPVGWLQSAADCEIFYENTGRPGRWTVAGYFPAGRRTPVGVNECCR